MPPGRMRTTSARISAALIVNDHSGLPDHPFVALWSMCKALRRDRLPETRRHPLRLHGSRSPRAVLADHRERRHRDLEGVPRSRRGPVHHGGSRSLRQVARRPAQLGRGFSRQPHSAPRSVGARPGIPHLECPQRVRPHQAGLPAGAGPCSPASRGGGSVRRERRRQTSASESESANARCLGQVHVRAVPGGRQHRRSGTPISCPPARSGRRAGRPHK